MIKQKKIIVTILLLCLPYILFIQGQYIYDKNKQLSPTKCFSKELAEFMIAAERGKIRKMRSLYKKSNININDIGECDMTPLIWLLYTDKPYINKQVLKELLQIGADPNFITPDGKSPVYVAARMENSKLKILLDNGGNPNIVNPKIQETALYNSIVDLNNIKLLISYGADINLKLSNESLLLHSIIGRQHEVAVYLLDNGVNIISTEIPEIIKYHKKVFASEFLYKIDNTKAALLKRGVNVDDYD